MKTILDPTNALATGLAAIRAEYRVPADFPAAVMAEAEAAATRRPDQHIDRTATPFVTLDPAHSTDLDQAFAIDRAGAYLLLHYAIADVAWFVADDGELDGEAWRRGETLYLPDGKAPLYPPVLSQGAASLLPDGPRPAIVFTIRIAPDGEVALDGAERALIRSRAKLAYETVRPSDLPADFSELAARIAASEARRGAARVDPPEQQVTALPGGKFELVFRPYLPSEVHNAALSLAANLAIAKALHSHRTGLFRVMAEPDAGALQRLRHTARAFALNWPGDMPLDAFETSLDPAVPREAAFMLAIRRAGNGASYRPWREGETPWHAAMAATYAQATAPLRRLADRYVVMATLAIAGGAPVPAAITDAFERLPKVMARAGARTAQVDRAVIDLAEAVMLDGDVGRVFDAIVTDLDERGARIQLSELPITERVTAHDVVPGDAVRVRLTEVDVARRRIALQRVSGASHVGFGDARA